MRRTCLFLFIFIMLSPAVSAYSDDWKVLCDPMDGTVKYSEAHPAHLMDYIIMKRGFYTMNDAVNWMSANCPSGRCTYQGACSTGPATSPFGEWKVMCHRDSKQIALTRAHPAHYPEYMILADRFMSQYDAQYWVDLNYPGGYCGPAGGGGEWSRPNSGNTGRSRTECENEICPACANAINLLGVSADPACDNCLNANRSRIDACVRGTR